MSIARPHLTAAQNLDDSRNLLLLSSRACLVWLGYRSDLRGRGGEEVGVVAWLWPGYKYRLSYWQDTQSIIPNVPPERKLLTAYVGHSTSHARDVLLT